MHSPYNRSLVLWVAMFLVMSAPAGGASPPSPGFAGEMGVLPPSYIRDAVRTHPDGSEEPDSGVPPPGG